MSLIILFPQYNDVRQCQLGIPFHVHDFWAPEGWSLQLATGEDNTSMMGVCFPYQYEGPCVGIWFGRLSLHFL
jgi:hypothetical protein